MPQDQPGAVSCPDGLRPLGRLLLMPATAIGSGELEV
jgi:hypothetical protein